MLINTVILFIRDTLPIFLLIALLRPILSQTRNALFLTVLIILILTAVIYARLDSIHQWGDGVGFELLKIACTGLSWIALCLLLIMTHVSGWSRIALHFVLLAGVVIPSSLHFVIYSTAYWSAQTQWFGLLTGTVIGLGISLSIATLLNLLLSLLAHHRLRLMLLFTFFAGQAAGITVMLEQIDYLPNSFRIWDTSAIVADASEYGHLLNVLIGYEATPSLSYVVVYLFCLTLPLVLAQRSGLLNAQARLI